MGPCGVSDGPYSLWNNMCKALVPHSNGSGSGSEDCSQRFLGNVGLQIPTRSKGSDNLRCDSGGEGKPQGTSAKLRTRPVTVADPSTSHDTPKMPQLVTLTRGAYRRHCRYLPFLSSLFQGGCGWEKRKVRALEFPKHADHDQRLSESWQSLLYVH